VSGNFKPRDTVRAQELRNQATPAERALWRAISKRQIAGAKFSRQMPVGPYFADFLCREHKLIVELDGWSHDVRAEHDARRDRFMASQGYTVVRFTNADVLSNLEGVVQSIALALAETSPPPAAVASQRLRLPASGRGEMGRHFDARAKAGLAR
jgi:very-short-patch-repair endonuclease